MVPRYLKYVKLPANKAGLPGHLPVKGAELFVNSLLNVNPRILRTGFPGG
jgi:hypothetical protein